MDNAPSFAGRSRRPPSEMLGAPSFTGLLALAKPQCLDTPPHVTIERAIEIAADAIDALPECDKKGLTPAPIVEAFYAAGAHYGADAVLALVQSGVAMTFVSKMMPLIGACAFGKGVETIEALAPICSSDSEIRLDDFCFAAAEVGAFFGDAELIDAAIKACQPHRVESLRATAAREACASSHQTLCEQLLLSGDLDISAFARRLRLWLDTGDDEDQEGPRPVPDHVAVSWRALAQKVPDVAIAAIQDACGDAIWFYEGPCPLLLLEAAGFDAKTLKQVGDDPANDVEVRAEARRLFELALLDEALRASGVGPGLSMP